IVGNSVVRDDQRRPGPRPIEDLGLDQPEEFPALQVLDLHPRIQMHLVVALAQAESKFDVLDRGALIALLIESADRVERVAANRAAAGPERAAPGAGGLVREVMKEVLVLREEVRLVRL